MLRCCVIERLTLQVVLRCRSFKLVKIPSFDCKIPLWCVLTGKWQLRWIYRFFGGRLCLLQLRDCKGCCVWRRLWAWVVLGNVIGSVAWKKMVVVLDQTNWKVLVKRAHYIKSLNVVTTNCSTFWNQKLWCGTLFPKKKMMKTDIQFKAYQQKRNMILDLGKLNLLKSGRGSFPPPPSPPPPHLPLDHAPEFLQSNWLL